MKAYEFVDVTLDAEFPCESVQVRNLRGREAISQLFWFDVDIVSREEGARAIDAMLDVDAPLICIKTASGILVEMKDRG